MGAVLANTASSVNIKERLDFSCAVFAADSTLVANAVNLDHPAIERTPARDLDPDSDLGGLPVTVAVGALEPAAVDAALDAGAAVAAAMRRAGLIEAAVLLLRGRVRVVREAPMQGP